MRSLITLTQRVVEHTDKEAAGFEEGWWWSIISPHHPVGYIESASPTKELSEQYARAALGPHAPEGTIDVVVGDTLMVRADDEARVLSFIADWATESGHNGGTVPAHIYANLAP